MEAAAQPIHKQPSGMGVLISACGLGALLVAVTAILLPVIRGVEDQLPDHDKLPATELAVAD